MENKVTIKLFASFREALGRGSLEWPLPVEAPFTVGDLLAALTGEYPAIAGPARISRVMVNQRYAGTGTLLAPGDEVAFIPPVGGG